MNLIKNLPSLGLACALMLLAQEKMVYGATNNTSQPTITVRATGEEKTLPDLASFQIGVASHGATAEQAVSENNTKIHNIINTIKSLNIDDKDIQTSEMSLYENNNTDEKNKNPSYSYVAENNLTIQVKDLSILGKLYDQAVKSGVNQSTNLNFSNQNTEHFLDIARQKAVQAAINKAKLLAQAAGLHLGSIITIDDSGDMPTPFPNRGLMLMSTASGSETPIQKGQISYKAAVTITFSLEK